MRRRARPIPLIAGLGAGLVSIVLGLVAVFGLMLDEREDARAELDRQRADIESRATAKLGTLLAAALDLAERDIAAALRDPLAPSEHLLLVERGEQLLPRRAGSGDTDARRLVEAEAAGTVYANDHEGLVERLGLVRGLPERYEDWLEHRRHHVLRADLELATTLSALERLDAAGALTPERARALLREGVPHTERSLDGWLPSLIAARARLSEADFVWLLERGARLARRTLVRVDDALARATAVGEALPEALLRRSPAASGAGGAAPAVAVIAGPWLVRAEAGRTVGRRVDLAATIREVHRQLGLPADVALTPLRSADRGPLAALEPAGEVLLGARSDTWDEARAALDQRLLFKALPLGAVAALSVVVVALALLLQRRRAAYIALRGRLLTAVTHELKTPLASIRAMAETLEARLGDHPGARDYPRRIVAASERLESLVDNVLSFARLERGAWRPRFEPIAVADLAAWLASEPALRAPRPVDFASEVPAGLTLVADVGLVRLLLSNLLDNAARYAEGERVKVRLVAERSARGIDLIVSDDGPGLGRDPRSLIDDLEQGRVERVRGTGLGLSICRHVMHLHGGRLGVRDSSTTGTTFVASFPDRASADTGVVPHPVPNP